MLRKIMSFREAELRGMQQTFLRIFCQYRFWKTGFDTSEVFWYVERSKNLEKKFITVQKIIVHEKV